MFRTSWLLLLVACSDGVGFEGQNDEPVDTSPDVTDAPVMGIGVAEVDFGSLTIGSYASTLIDVSNTGGVDLVMSSISVDPPFQVNPLELTVTPGSAPQITVAVQPTEYKDYSAVVTIRSNDETNPVLEIPVRVSVITDADGDGHDLVEAGGDDCDDTDATIHPDALDEWYDDVDSDCAGNSDWDRDGDGWESDAHEPDVEDGGGDCQDLDPSYFPGAEDVPYDNRDTNCDGADDYDFDGDGSRSDEYGDGLDCDDYDADINTSGTEQFNGKDDDCDGDVDVAAEFGESEYAYTGEDNYDRSGYALALGDLNGDGMAEVVVGAPYYGASSASANSEGAYMVFQGGATLPESDDTRAADELIEGDGSSDDLGYAVSVLRDFDGDGMGDVAVTAYGVSGGAVFVMTGEDVLSGNDTGDAIAKYTGASGNYLGRGLGTNLDLDADGLDEVVALYSDSSSNSIAIDYGGNSGSTTVSGMDVRWQGSGSNEIFYRNAPVGGDFDGDGYTDLVVSDGEDDTSASNGGTIWCVWGANARYSGSTALSSVASVIGAGTATDQGFGWTTQLGPDWNGDGSNELWVYEADTALYVFGGGGGRGAVTPDAALVTYTWNTSSGDVGRLRQAGDFTGDGVNDMITYLDGSSLGAMQMYGSERQSGTFDGYVDYSASVKGTTTHGNGNVGYGMAAIGADIDGDGDWDYAAGDPEWADPSGTGVKYNGEIAVFMNERE